MRPVVVIPRSPTITMFSGAKVSFTAVTAERSRTPLSRQQLPILIQQGPELDQLINVNLGWLHARQSLPDPTMSGPLRLVTAPLPAPRVAPDQPRTSPGPPSPQRRSNSQSL